MKTTEQMIEVMTALKDGEDIEFRNANTDEEWNACTKPIWNWEWFDYRIKPKLKPVDLSVLIDSGIDCTWIDVDGYAPLDNSWSVSALKELSVELRMDYWFSEHNFSAVNNTVLDLIEAGFEVETDGQAGKVSTAFKITGLQPDRCWPREVSDEK